VEEISSVSKDNLGNREISAPAQNALGTVESNTITFTVGELFSYFMAARNSSWSYEESTLRSLGD